jgi:hypothetical protein
MLDIFRFICRSNKIMSAINVPSFRAWKNVQPGPNQNPTLHITGIFYATLCQTPYLTPVGAPEALTFQLALTTKTGICPQVELPREVTPYTQTFVGNGTQVTIKMPGNAQSINVPIEAASFS